MRYIQFPILAAVLFFADSLVFAQASERKVLNSLVPPIISHLTPVGRYPSTNHLNLAIGLPVRNQAALDEFLHQLYDPGSTNYHKYLTPQEYTERYGPTEADYSAVIKFAVANGLKVTATHPNRVVLDVEGSVPDIERAFQVTLHVYQHPAEARMFYAPDTGPSVDAGIPVLSVSGLDNFSLPHPNSQKKSSPDATPKLGSGPSGAYASNDFRAAYVPGVALDGSGQSVALLEFDGYYTSDITGYENSFGLPSVTLTNVAVDGGVGNPGNGNSEVALDIEMVIAMAPGLSKVIVYEAPNPSPWADIISRIANDNAARQISCSWGGGSPDATSEQLFLQMAAQGQSFYNASGDSDAFSGSIPFPSDSTNITQVGGTTLTTTGPGGSWSSETVWNWGQNKGKYTGSSGGISTYYPIPGWQLGINMTTNHGSTTMRNVPDVALTADNIYVKYNNGQAAAFGGTSCAAPLWAAVTALVNQQAAAAGQPAVGFVNPAIYTIGKGVNFTADFHDITTGNNFTRSSSSNFSAVPGYDLCTGWGTPNGSNLINALLAAPLSILTPPVNQTATNGNNVAFSVIAGGQPPFGYRWLFNGTNLPASGNISGVTSNVLAIASVTTNNAGNYRVVVSNFSGAMTSSVATLTVITVASTNHPPALTAISNKTINELSTLTFTNIATDPDGNAFAFSLGAGAPTNAVVNPTTGVFAWTPTEAQGPATNVISIIVTDNGTPSLGATQSFTVVVLESNLPPALVAISNHTLHAGMTLIITNSATDADVPANRLTFSLDPGAPAAATINGTNGILVWTTGTADVDTTNNLTVRATDDGTPNLSDAKSFIVTVVSQPAIGSITVTNGLAVITWDSIPGQAYLLQKKNGLDEADWTSLTNIVAAGYITTATDATTGADHKFYRISTVP